MTWQGDFTTTTPGVQVNWQWAAAAYTNFASNPSALQVKTVDDNHADTYQNSDHAGTPENFKPYVTGGARGGGGSNWTGSLSATVSVTPSQAPTQSPATGPAQSPASISGFVLNADGSVEVGVTVTLTGMTAQGQVTLTTTTDSTGAYSFADVARGAYTVTETPPLATTRRILQRLASLLRPDRRPGRLSAAPTEPQSRTLPSTPAMWGTQFNFVNS